MIDIAGSRDPRVYAPPPGSHSSPNQHYSDPRRDRPPPGGVGSQDPSHSHGSQNRLYSRSHDPRSWGEQSYGHGRSLTPGPPPVRSSVATPTPVHPRAQTPVNQMYVTNQQRGTNGVPPQLSASGRPPERRGGAEGNYAGDIRTNDPRVAPDYGYRQMSDFDSNAKNAYTRERQMEPQTGSHSYGSLPRQRDLKEKRYYSHGNLQPSLMSSSAQV